jgi:hypothetical protein
MIEKFEFAPALLAWLGVDAAAAAGAASVNTSAAAGSGVQSSSSSSRGVVRVLRRAGVSIAPNAERSRKRPRGSSSSSSSSSRDGGSGASLATRGRASSGGNGSSSIVGSARGGGGLVGGASGRGIVAEPVATNSGAAVHQIRIYDNSIVRMLDVGGGGDCFFRCVAHQLGLQAIATTWQDVRLQMTTYASGANMAAFYDFVAAFLLGVDMQVVISGLQRQGECARPWFDAVVPSLAAWTYSREVRVLQGLAVTQHFLPPDGVALVGAPIVVWFSGAPFSADGVGHYRSVVP